MRALTLGRALAAVVGVVAALAVVPAPAQADEVGSTSTTNVVLYDQCQDHQIDYSLQVAAGSSWRLQLQVYDPNGFTSQGFVANSADGAAPSGQFATKQFCGSETPGTWTVKGTLCQGAACQFTPAGEGTALPDTTFVVRRAQTTASLQARRTRDGRYLLKARVAREEPQGLAASEGVFVQFERLVDDQWRPVVRRQIPTVHGVATLRRGFARGTRVRAVVPERNNYSGSSSGIVRLKR